MAIKRRGFGRRVRALRIERGPSLRALARRVGVSPPYLSRIEREESPPPREAVVVALARTLGQDPDEFLALAGHVASDVTDLIRRRPQAATAVRLIAGIPDPALGQVLTYIRDLARGVTASTKPHATPSAKKFELLNRRGEVVQLIAGLDEIVKVGRSRQPAGRLVEKAGYRIRKVRDG